MMRDYEIKSIQNLINIALAEDIGPGDVTSSAILTGNEIGIAQAIAKSDMVVAGLEVFREVFHAVDSDLTFTTIVTDGEYVAEGTSLAQLGGKLKAILMAERVALNLFQRMCGIATASRQYVKAVEGTKAKILDTRKTSPCLRILDKYAVRVGGASNHRFALYDGVLIKDNHIAAAGGISAAIGRARQRIPHTVKIEIEVKNIEELEQAVAAGVDVILLDNMSLSDMSKAVELVRGRIPLEASGGVSLSTVRAIAETGVDFISVGALTHSVMAADISLMIQS
ncbi:MAG: nicotinate-nucleotide pyrophosphorylase [carboxylating] [Syntrophus sp. SKADARSKE-3]|nr:nicotinate-nucleotide pyrophosphorylase [carboxylating] [Syntrophus sp. SKADARSKE-3]